MAAQPKLADPVENQESAGIGYGVDELLGDVQVSVSETVEFTSAFTLGALGQILMPFVEEPTPYIPAEGVKTDKGKVSLNHSCCH